MNVLEAIDTLRVICGPLDDCNKQPLRFRWSGAGEPVIVMRQSDYDTLPQSFLDRTASYGVLIESTDLYTLKARSAQLQYDFGQLAVDVNAALTGSDSQNSLAAMQAFAGAADSIHDFHAAIVRAEAKQREAVA